MVNRSVQWLEIDVTYPLAKGRAVRIGAFLAHEVDVCK